MENIERMINQEISLAISFQNKSSEQLALQILFKIIGTQHPSPCLGVLGVLVNSF